MAQGRPVTAMMFHAALVSLPSSLVDKKYTISRRSLFGLGCVISNVVAPWSKQIIIAVNIDQVVTSQEL